MTQEADLWNAFLADRTIENRNALAELYGPLVRRAAARYRKDWNLFEDKLSLGWIGLFDAIERYDIERGIPFAGFAWERVWGAIVDGSAVETGIPRSAWRAKAILENAAEELDEPSDEQLADFLSWPTSKVRNVRWGAIGVLPADTSTGTSSVTDETFSGLVVDQVAERVGNAVEQLDDRAGFILALHYRQGWTFAAIAEFVGASQARVNSVHTDALVELRGMLLDGLEPPGTPPWVAEYAETG